MTGTDVLYQHAAASEASSCDDQRSTFQNNLAGEVALTRLVSPDEDMESTRTTALSGTTPALRGGQVAFALIVRGLGSNDEFANLLRGPVWQQVRAVQPRVADVVRQRWG